jgi:hypothetical protein
MNDKVAANHMGDSPGSINPVTSLTNTQAFARDPLLHTKETLDDIVARLRPIIARQRKARDDDAIVAAEQARIKQLNKKHKKEPSP